MNFPNRFGPVNSLQLCILFISKFIHFEIHARKKGPAHQFLLFIPSQCNLTCGCVKVVLCFGSCFFVNEFSCKWRWQKKTTTTTTAVEAIHCTGGIFNWFWVRFACKNTIQHFEIAFAKWLCRSHLTHSNKFSHTIFLPNANEITTGWCVWSTEKKNRITMIDAVAIFNQNQKRNQIYYSRMNENTKLAMIIVTMTRMTVAVKAMLRCLVANCYCLIFLAIAAF